MITSQSFHGGGVDQPLIWYQGSSTDAASQHGLFSNWQGSITAIADATGNAIAVNGYDAYGIPNDTNIGRFQYTGQIWLEELGLYHYKARVYSPTLGRFLQTDPIGYEDQYNLYAYVGNDPVNKIDPTGERRELPSKNPEFKQQQQNKNGLNNRGGSKPSLTQRIAQKVAIIVQVIVSIGQKNRKRDRIKVYRVFGGKAGVVGGEDSTNGTYWTTADPRQYGTKSAVRDEFALPVEWGNDLDYIAEGTIEVGDPNITSFGIAAGEATPSGYYPGGGRQLTIRNSLTSVQGVVESQSGLQEDPLEKKRQEE